MEQQPQLHITSRSEQRTSDRHGSGWYGAPRGSRKHRGVDFVCCGGTEIYSIQDEGVVSKIGIPYKPWPDDKEGYTKEQIEFHNGLRYIEVAHGSVRVRYMYVSPVVGVGDIVLSDVPVGISAGIDFIYNGIQDHIHFEVIDSNGERVHPIYYLESIEA